MVTVSVVDAAAPEGVTVGGERLQDHDAVVGNPEHASETVELKPSMGVIETEVVPLWPPVTDIDTGEAAMEKSGCAKVYVADATALFE